MPSPPKSRRSFGRWRSRPASPARPATDDDADTGAGLLAGDHGALAEGADDIAVVDALAADSPLQAERLAYVLLSRRDHAAAELAGKLADKGFAPAVIGDLLAALHERGYLDDARYAAQFVNARAGRGHGPARIRRELEQVGVAGDHIAQALAEGHDWHALARQLKVRRFGAAAPAGWPEKARQARFLQYRGFSPDHIRSALEAPDFDP